MIVVSLLILFVASAVYLFRRQEAKKRVTVVVVGDIGRSPRMQYHALSLAKEGYDVDLIGYGGSAPHKDLSINKKIHIYYIKKPPGQVRNMPRFIMYAIKVICQSFTLFVILLFVQKPRYMLMQNPPAIPSMAICGLVAVMRNTKFIVDWHNYGHTLLALSLGESHILVSISKWFEKFFGRLSHANLCVTEAMREDLKTNWKIDAVTMYDRPPMLFKRTDLLTQHKLFCKLSKDYEVFRNEEDGAAGATTFTLPLADGTAVKFAHRPAFIMSSTSWTKDEDFSILLKALEKYEIHRATEEDNLPDVVCVITGKGPEKKHYRSMIARMTWRHVRFCTPWLDAEDYPRLLGSADLGVCLHKSSSGLDLPMKVVDMFGCGLPVCAINFKSIGELVRHGENGLIFNNADELAVQLQDLLRGFPDKCEKLSTFRLNLQTFQSVRWEEAWKESMLPLLD